MADRYILSKIMRKMMRDVINVEKKIRKMQISVHTVEICCRKTWMP